MNIDDLNEVGVDCRIFNKYKTGYSDWPVSESMFLRHYKVEPIEMGYSHIINNGGDFVNSQEVSVSGLSREHIGYSILDYWGLVREEIRPIRWLPVAGVFLSETMFIDMSWESLKFNTLTEGFEVKLIQGLFKAEIPTLEQYCSILNQIGHYDKTLLHPTAVNPVSTFYNYCWCRNEGYYVCNDNLYKGHYVVGECEGKRVIEVYDDSKYLCQTKFILTPIEIYDEELLKVVARSKLIYKNYLTIVNMGCIRDCLKNDDYIPNLTEL